MEELVRMIIIGNRIFSQSTQRIAIPVFESEGGSVGDPCASLLGLDGKKKVGSNPIGCRAGSTFSFTCTVPVHEN